MPDLKYLYRVLYIAFFNKLLIFFFYYQESNILIIAFSSVVTIAEWLDGSFESQNRLWKAQQWFETRKPKKQLKVKVHIFKNKRINCRFLKIIHCSNNSVTSEKYVNDINLVPKMDSIIKVQRPVSSAPINSLYHRPLLAACMWY